MNSVALQDFTFRLIRLGVILALFTPLALGPFGISFSEYPKAVYFRVLIEIILILWVIRFLISPDQPSKVSLLTMLTVSFLVILFLTSLFGFNFERSFWGSLEVGGGLVNVLHYIAFFLILVSTFSSKDEWLFLLRWAGLAGFLVVLAGFMQKLNLAHFYGVGLASGRISGTLSNPVYFGSYLTMTIFFTLYLLVVEKKRYLKLGWGIVATLSFIALLMSGSRGAFVGMIFGFGLLTLLIFYFLVYPNPVLRRKILLTTFFISLILFLSFVFYLPNLNFIEQKGVDRLFSIFNPDVLQGRLPPWKVAIRAWKDSPILGWGYSSFGYLYDKYFDANLGKQLQAYFIFFDAHDRIFNFLAETGILGIAGYLLIFVGIFFVLFKTIFKRESYSLLPVLVLIALFFAYFFQNLFAFDTVSTYVLFFFLLAFISNNYPVEVKLPPFLSRVWNIWVAKSVSLFLLAVSVLSIYFVNLQPALANYDFVKGLMIEKKDYMAALDYFKKATSRSTPYVNELMFQRASRDLQALEGRRFNRSQQLLIVRDLKETIPYIEQRIQKKDLRYANSYQFLAEIWEWYFLVTSNPEAFQRAELIAKKGIEFNPEWKEFYYILGRLAIYQGDYAKAKNYFKKSFELSLGKLTDEYNTKKIEGLAYMRVKDYPRAAKTFLKAVDALYIYLKYFVKPDTEPDLKIGNEADVFIFELTSWLHWRLGDKDTALEIYQKAFEVFPGWEDRLNSSLDKMKKLD